MVFLPARRWIPKRLALLFFIGLTAGRPSLLRADLADDELLSEKTFALRTGAGYKDNVTLSHFNPQASPFFRTGLDADWLKEFFDTDAHLMLLLSGDDWVYWNRPSTRHEDLWTAAADYKKNFEADLSFSTLAFYGFENQVLDLSAEENLAAAPAKVIGHTIAIRPAGRWNFETNFWTQLKLDATRQFFSRPADSYTRVGPEFSVGGDYGKRSGWSVGYEPSWQRYDHGRATDSTGIIPSDTTRIDFRQRLELNDTHNWDDHGRLQNISQLFAEYDIDNGGGFFDYYRYGGALELDYDDDARWELSARADASRFQFLHQTISLADATRWYIADITVDLAARRKLTHWLKAFVEYEYERSLSNRPQEDYQANTVSGGLEWIF